MVGVAASIKVKLDDSDARSSAKALSSALAGDLTSAGESASKYASAVTSVGAALGAAAVALTAFGAASVQTWASTQREIAVLQTIAEPAAFSVGRVVEETQRLAAASGIDTRTQITALYEAVGSGVQEASEAFQLLGVANSLAVGGMTDTATAVDVLTSVLNAFNLKADSSAKVANSLFVAAREGKVRVEELAQNLGTVAASAANAGLSIDEMNAAVAVITTRGLTASVAVTQLRALLDAVSSATDKQKGAAAALGISLDVVTLKTKGYSAFLRDLSEATGNSQEKLFQLLGRTEAVSAVLNQTADGGLAFGRAMRSMGEDIDYVAQATQVAQGSIENQFQRISTLSGIVTENVGRWITESDAFKASILSVRWVLEDLAEKPAQEQQGFVPANEKLAEELAFRNARRRIQAQQEARARAALSQSPSEPEGVVAFSEEDAAKDMRAAERELVRQREERKQAQEEAAKQAAKDRKEAEKQLMSELSDLFGEFDRTQEAGRKLEFENRLKAQEEYAKGALELERQLAEAQAQIRSDAKELELQRMEEQDAERQARLEKQAAASLAFSQDIGDKARGATAAIAGGLAEGLATGTLEADKMFGRILSNLGQGLIAMGTAALATQLFSAIPILAPFAGPPGAGAVAGAAAIAAGVGLLALGSSIGGGGSSSSAPSSPSFSGGGAQGGVSPVPQRQPSGFLLDRGGDRSVVYNITMTGPIGGSPRSIAADLSKMGSRQGLVISKPRGD